VTLVRRQVYVRKLLTCASQRSRQPWAKTRSSFRRSYIRFCQIQTGVVKPHKVRYYLEQRDPDFAKNDGQSAVRLSPGEALEESGGPKKAAVSKKKPTEVAIISYDEKAGIQAIATTARTCRPNPACMRPSHASSNTSATARSACWEFLVSRLELWRRIWP
jgi:hypothetical protein